MQDNAVIDLIQSSGLQRIKSDLKSLTLESVRIWTEVEQEENIPISDSKLGGRPDLPKSFTWPEYEGRHLHFIAQINLKHIDGTQGQIELPRDGIISFFYDALEQPWGFDPMDRGRWKVIYFEDVQGFERMNEPKDILEQGSFSTTKISFSRQTNLPPSESLSIDRLRLNDEERELYWDLSENVQEHNKSTEFTHKLLGHPDTIQGEMQLECQLVSNGLYCGDSTGYDDPRKKVLESGATSWRLLLQIDSEEDIGMMWGDVGRLYFWILEEDLKALNFDNVWVVLQCS